MFRFEKLDVWHKAVRYVNDVYTVTCNFPDTERYGLTSQMRRAAVSVSANIAEGSSRASDADFARFIEISYGSLMEVISHASVAKLQGFVTKEAYEHLYRESEEIARMLSGLRASLLRATSS